MGIVSAVVADVRPLLAPLAPLPADVLRAANNRYRRTRTAELLAEAECLLWDLAELERDLAADPSSWAHPAQTRAFLLAAIEDANAELERREALRTRPEAPGWPARWPDRRAEIDTVKARLDLPRFIQAMFPGVELKPRGRQLVCRCLLPGHDERTPSFAVDPQKQVWYCHGCHRGGDIFTLTQHCLGLTTFVDALDVLTQEAGIAAGEAVARGR